MHAPSKVPTRHSSTRRPRAASNKANDESSIAWVGPDNVTAFVRCLRLLYLSKKDDWPSITTATFAARSNLQTRIRCTEWSLYRLFEIWDLSYTKDKLRPFFPPQAPLQSLNLRAALFRGLTDLKKNGLLGREITLRKTMLDDCKGDKFEEVLYAFAMTVLRKQANTRGDSSLNLALADSLNKGKQDALLPLVIVHRQAVARQIDQRKVVQQQISKYEGNLADQRQALNDRKKLLEWSLEVPVVADADLAKERLLSNWSGDEKHAQFILGHGNPPSNRVQYQTFQQTWTLAQNGHSETPQRPSGLLDDLNARVSEQQARLGKWKKFHASMQQHKLPNQKAASPKKQSSPPKIVFDKHQDLYIDKNGVQYSAAGAPPPLSDKHASLLESLRAELFNWKISTEAAYRNRQGTLDEDPNLFSGASARQQRSESPSSLPGQILDDQENSPNTVEKELVAHDETVFDDQEKSPEVVMEVVARDKTAETSDGQTESRSPPIMASDTAKASIDPTSPSTPCFLIPQPRNRTKRETEQSQAPPSLQERTRQSMALFSSASSPPQRRVNQTSNPRFSQVFPINQFETPRKANTSAKRMSDVSMAKGSPSGDSGASTPKEKLFSQEAEYASVFKSRPKIALSPTMSPERSALELEAVLREDMERLELSDER